MQSDKSIFPYAKALFELASESNILNDIKADVLLLSELVKNSTEFNDIISNPIIKKSKKKEIITNLLNSKIHNTTQKFLVLLIDKTRISQLEAIANTFLELFNKSLNKTVVHLTTASAISDDMQKNIATSIATNANVEVIHHVDSNIIGGFIAEFDNKMLVKSIRTQITKLKHKFN
jgi:F-type H+-transporting ATPase subunit delta